MKSSRSCSLPLQLLLVCVALLGSVVSAVKLEVFASPGEGVRRCVLKYSKVDTLILGHFEIKSFKEGQSMDVEIFDDNNPPNKFWTKKRIDDGVQKFSFTVHEAGTVHFCFNNRRDDGVQPHTDLKKTINLHIDTGAEAEDVVADTHNQKLKPMEVELYRLERISDAMLKELDQMRVTEENMRDVNESTNERVAWFSTLSIITLVGSAGWQIYYLRQFFQAKKLL